MIHACHGAVYTHEFLEAGLIAMGCLDEVSTRRNAFICVPPLCESVFGATTRWAAKTSWPSWEDGKTETVACTNKHRWHDHLCLLRGRLLLNSPPLIAIQDMRDLLLEIDSGWERGLKQLVPAHRIYWSTETFASRQATTAFAMEPLAIRNLGCPKGVGPPRAGLDPKGSFVFARCSKAIGADLS